MLILLVRVWLIFLLAFVVVKLPERVLLPKPTHNPPGDASNSSYRHEDEYYEEFTERVLTARHSQLRSNYKGESHNR